MTTADKEALPTRMRAAATRRFRIWFWAGLALYFALLGFDSIARMREFTPDSRYYVEMARNIRAGNGIAHNTHHLGEASVLDDLRQPSPTTIWTPLYPILIAGAIALGVPAANAALLLSLFSGAVILVIVYALARRAYNESLALMAVAYLAVSGFFFKVSTHAWSETTGIAFLALAFFLVALDRSTRARQWWIPVAAGVTACLAFYTRYALLPMAGIVGLLLIERKDWRATLRNWALFGGAYLLVALPLFLRNAHLTDTFLGPNRPPSDQGLFINLMRLYATTATSLLAPFQFRSVSRWALIVEWLLVTLLVLAVLVGLFSRRFRSRVRGGIRPSFLAGKRYVFTAWAVGYLAYIVVYRSFTHFDPIDARLLAPGLIPLAVPMTAFVAGYFRLTETGIRRWTTGFLVLGLVMAGMIAFALPVTDYSKWVARSERMSWVLKETTERDLVIGDDLIDVAALKPAQTILLLDITTVPGLHVKPDGFFASVRKHCARYDHTFLVLSKNHPRQGWQETRGEFLADLMDGRLEKYPDVTPVREFSDGYVFEIACPR